MKSNNHGYRALYVAATLSDTKKEKKSQALQALQGAGASDIHRNKRKHWCGRLACPKCGICRVVWGQSVEKKGNYTCRRCVTRPFGAQTGAYKRGWHLSRGYRVTQVPRGHWLACMGSGKSHTILQHRLVMAEHLGRPLESWEHVHHKNGNKQDNRVVNLTIMSRDTHRVVEQLVSENKKLKRTIICLTQRLARAKVYSQ